MNKDYPEFDNNTNPFDTPDVNKAEPSANVHPQGFEPSAEVPATPAESYPDLVSVFDTEADEDFALEEDINFDADFNEEAQETPSVNEVPVTEEAPVTVLEENPYKEVNSTPEEVTPYAAVPEAVPTPESVQAPPVYTAPPVQPPTPQPVQYTPVNNQYNSSESNPNHYYNPAPQPVQNPTYNYSQPPVTPPVNNGQPPYTNQPPVYYYPAPEPKKKKGPNALIIILWVLVGLFALGFLTTCGYIIMNSGMEEFLGIETTETSIPNEDNDKDSDNKDSHSVDETTPDKDGNNTVVPLPDGDKDYYSDTNIILHNKPDDYTDTSKYTTQYAYKTIAESTIGIVCYENGFNDEPASQGTGIIASKDGYILTNSHVIGDSRSLLKVQVITNDGTTYEAKVIGYDSRTDLAVLKINAKNLTPAVFCDSKYVEVGQDVIAIGNPGGMEFQNSLTRGVVSAVNRKLSLSAQVSYIQTDAAINPGNSGGPLCNMYGQVIGINTAKISSSAYEGMGFAIPSQTVKDIVDDLISKGYVENRVRLGISGTPVSSTNQFYYNTPAGIRIAEISKDGPCYNKGIEKGDIITAIDKTEIQSFSDIYAILENHKPGDKVTLSVYKTSQNKAVRIEVILAADQGETQQ